LTNVDIANAIAEAQAKRAAKVGRTAVEVLKDIQDLAKEAWRDGDLKTALKGLELEGKHLAMFTDRVEGKLTGQTVIVVKDRSANG